MNIAPTRNAWWHWLIGLVMVTTLVTATFITAGGAGAGLMAIGCAVNGAVLAGASTMTTALAFASVGAEMTFSQHIQYHQTHGYKGFYYMTANINFWEILTMLM